MEDFAIKVENVSKEFKLPHEKSSSIKSMVVNFYKRKKGYEIQRALNNVSFEVKKGEFFGIVGRNGSGKSTLLKLLADIYTPTSGQVHVRGTLTPFIELGVGFNQELTGRENVFLNGALLGFNRKEMQDMYKDIVEFAELERFMDQKLKNYSSGMQVRLAFSIAIRAKSEILLLDEVLAVGDEAFQKKCYDYFESLKRNQQTVIIVTHDMLAVEKFCTSGILIDDGKIINQGSAEVISKAYSDMFANPTESSGEEKPQNRFGDMRLKFLKPIIKLEQPASYGTKIEVQTSVQCREAVEGEIIVAYALKDSIGQKLFGAKSEAKELSKMKTGENKKIIFSFPNILNKGKYFIDLSIYAAKEDRYCDIWIDCGGFSTKTLGVQGYPLVVKSNFREV